jgi:hypothetical protein
MKTTTQKSRKWMLSFFMVSLMLFSVFIGMAGSAQDESKQESENNEIEITGAIVGIVTDVEAKPIAGAVVYLVSGDDNTNVEKLELKAETNERGYFEFKELPRGLYRLKVHMEGYQGWGREIKLPAGETIKIDIILEKLVERPEQPEENEEITYGVVIGQVFNALEEVPIGGAVVTIHNLETEREIKLETNERGMFEVKLPRGKYVLIVEARGFWPYKEELIVKVNSEQKMRIPLKPKEIEPEPEVRPTLCGHIFDAVTDEPIFGWVEISQGSPEIPGPNIPEMDKKEWYEEKELDGKTRQAESDRPIEESEETNEVVYGVVAGYVYNPVENEPISGALVIIHHLESERELKFETNERGIFEAKLPRGKYVLVVEARGFWPYKEELIVRGNDEQKLKIPMKLKEVQKPEKPEDYRLWRTFTDRGGWYEYFEIPPGHYEIRAFAHGHIMFYNEINIEDDSHIYLDIYLLREYCPPEPEPEPEPLRKSLIAGHVFNARTKAPIAGAVVCAIPIRLIKERLDDANIDLDNINLEDIDIDLANVDFNQDVEVEYSDMDPNTGLEKEYPGKESKEYDYDKSDYEKPETKTRCCNEEPKPDCDGEIDHKKIIRKFCTRTDERGNFKLKIPAGNYVLIVKARGYQMFAHKFSIRPYQKMWIRVPLKPMVQTPERPLNAEPIDDQGRPLPKERPGLNDEGDPERPTKDSEEQTQDIGSGAGASAAPLTSSILGTILGILMIVAVILGAMVFRKYNKTGKPEKTEKKND